MSVGDGLMALSLLAFLAGGALVAVGLAWKSIRLGILGAWLMIIGSSWMEAHERDALRVRVIALEQAHTPEATK